MKRKPDTQLGLFDQPAWEQEATARTDAEVVESIRQIQIDRARLLAMAEAALKRDPPPDPARVFKLKAPQWHPFGECDTASPPCPRCKGKVYQPAVKVADPPEMVSRLCSAVGVKMLSGGAEQRIEAGARELAVARATLRDPGFVPETFEHWRENWIAGRAAALVKVRGMNPSDAKAQASREMDELEAT